MPRFSRCGFRLDLAPASGSDWPRQRWVRPMRTGLCCRVGSERADVRVSCPFLARPQTREDALGLVADPVIVIGGELVQLLDQPVRAIGRHPLRVAVQSSPKLISGPEFDSLAAGQQHAAKASSVPACKQCLCRLLSDPGVSEVQEETVEDVRHFVELVRGCKPPTDCCANGPVRGIGIPKGRAQFLITGRHHAPSLPGTSSISMRFPSCAAALPWSGRVGRTRCRSR
ncbi:hypothetical protein OV450_5588 [Actinobacteria bacterium OV450]|nr:hypothetical protein OV450_5588 [Actinobacteria bacterium OV450]